MQANVKGHNPPTRRPFRSHDHTRKNFCGTALLVARRSTMRAGWPAPAGCLKVSHFFSFGKDCRCPDESAVESAPGNEAAVMCAETKFSKINQFTPFKQPAGRDEGGTPGGQA
jgi:hypothetical protein